MGFKANPSFLQVDISCKSLYLDLNERKKIHPGVADLRKMIAVPPSLN